jgi:hypothetical protein
MTWIAIVFFCAAENDCKFWFAETTRPLECEKSLIQAMKVLDEAKVPVMYGTCIVTKGKST